MSIDNYYNSTGYNAAWTDQENIDVLFFNLNYSYNEGLMPNGDHLERIKRLMDELNNEDDLKKQADIDLLILLVLT